MNSVADLLAVLCMLSPCYANDQVMQIPVPEVPPRTWIETVRVITSMAGMCCLCRKRWGADGVVI